MHGRVHENSCVCPNAAHLRILWTAFRSWAGYVHMRSQPMRGGALRALPGAHPVPVRAQHTVARDRGPQRSVRLVDEEVRRPVRLHRRPRQSHAWQDRLSGMRMLHSSTCQDACIWEVLECGRQSSVPCPSKCRCSTLALAGRMRTPRALLQPDGRTTRGCQWLWRSAFS